MAISGWVSQWVSEWLIVSDLEIAIASLSFASLFSGRSWDGGIWLLWLPLPPFWSGVYPLDLALQMSGGFRAGPSCHLNSRKKNKSHLVFSRSGVWSLVGWLVSVMGDVANVALYIPTKKWPIGNLPCKERRLMSPLFLERQNYCQYSKVQQSITWKK